MRIRELDIRRYGPLPELPRIPLSGFTLFYGHNEHGKTLLIDAIIRLLFDNKLGRGKKGFEALKRVAERPEGSLLLEHDGEELLLARGSSFVDCFDPPLGIVDFRNIFVARDSDLEIDNSDNFYTQVSERFTDIRTKEIRGVLKRLQEYGRLTRPDPEADLANNRETGFAARKVETAKELIERIDALLGELREERFDELERELAERRERQATLEAERSLQEAAAEAERLQRAESLLASFTSLDTRLAALAPLAADGLSGWRSREDQLRGYRNELEQVREKRLTREQSREKTNDALAQARERFETLDARHRFCETNLKPKIYELRRLREESAAARPLGSLWPRIALVSFVLCAGAAAGIIANGAPFFVAAASLAFIAGCWAVVQIVTQRKRAGRLERDLDALVLDAAPVHDGEHSLEAVERSITSVVEARAAAEREFDRREREMEQIKRDLESNRERTGKLQSVCATLTGEIADIMQRSGRETIDEYRLALEEKNRLQAERQKIEGILESEVGAPPAGGEVVTFWNEEILRRKRNMPAAPPHDPARYRELMEMMAEEEETLARLEERLDTRREDLGKLAYRVTASGILESDEIRCRTTGDLVEIREQLARFSDGILEDASIARETMGLFQSIEREEKSRVAELFGSGKAVSAYFSDITEGRYTEVHFDPETEQISVARPEGGHLGIEVLSGGTRDQLCFAIRLSLGERFLGGDRGFFILDDPFIKADEERLECQMNLLKRLVSRGWQILYFTAKREVRDLLSDDIGSGRVKLVELTLPV